MQVQAAHSSSTISTNPRQRIAVVGSGAAAMGAIAGLIDRQVNARICVFDIARNVSPPPHLDGPSRDDIVRFYDNVYSSLRANFNRKFPPPKTHFGESIARHQTHSNFSLFKSETFGGLTNYWGGTVLPFTSRELEQWPAAASKLEESYRRIAEIVGLSGRDDDLLDYFGRDYHTRPPIRPTAVLEKLDVAVNTANGSSGFRILSGVNRCAVETREGHANSCVYCGECMAGCFRDSVYSTRRTIEAFLHDRRIDCVRGARVRRVCEDGQFLEIETSTGVRREGPFESVFLCAGCPGTTEILMRSAGISDNIVMRDNAVYVFPILYLGRLPKSACGDEYLSLCNLIFACIPANDGHFAQVQVYPNFDYLWRYNVPRSLWPIVRPLLRASRRRLMWGRLYLHSDLSQSYRLRLNDDRLQFDLAREPLWDDYHQSVFASLRAAIGREGFWVPPFRPLRQKANSHYAATFPFGNKNLGVSPNGEALPGVYICDSTCFPNAPAVSPTFSIMAHAYRVAGCAIESMHFAAPMQQTAR